MTSNYDNIRQLYLQKLSGSISAQDEAMLQEWLANDPYVQEIWQSFEKERKTLDTDSFIAKLDAEKELLRVKKRLALPVPAISRLPAYKLVAASVLGLALAATAYWFYGSGFVSSYQEQLTRNTEAVPGKPQAVQLVTANGLNIQLNEQQKNKIISRGNLQLHTRPDELSSIHSGGGVVMATLLVPERQTYKIILPDGSKVWLNSASQLRFPSKFAGASRDVYLEGEGFFEIAKKVRAPFVVHAGEMTVHVLGTRFNLSAYQKEDIQTSLVDGGVELQTENGQGLRLYPGDAGVYKGNHEFAKAVFDSTELLAWMEGIYYFHHLPLSDLAVVIRRWYGMTVVFDRKELASQKVTGLMEKDSPEHLLSDLKLTLGIASYIRNDQLHLK